MAENPPSRKNQRDRKIAASIAPSLAEHSKCRGFLPLWRPASAGREFRDEKLRLFRNCSYKDRWHGRFRVAIVQHYQR
jgi:hypothetical protein